MRPILGVLASLALAVSPALADSASEGRDLYLKAAAADQAGNYSDALSLAQRATAKRGAHAVPARLLYADVLVHQGELQRAKTFYIALHQIAPVDIQLMIEARVIAINASLKLDATDGLTTTTATTTANTTATTAATTTSTAPTESELYQQALEAYNVRDFARALTLAQRTAVTGGAHALDAKVLYADALYSMKDYRRAKEIYLALRTRTTGTRNAAIEKRIVAVNKALGQPADAP